MVPAKCQKGYVAEKFEELFTSAGRKRVVEEVPHLAAANTHFLTREGCNEVSDSEALRMLLDQYARRLRIIPDLD
jgi:hypothetical protein